MKEKLQKLFDIGITKTWFKSNSIDKVNELRTELKLPLRDTTVKIENNHFDKDCVDGLWETDFSELDGYIPGYHNTAKYSVLTFAGIGFIADTFSVEVSGGESPQAVEV